MHALGAARPAEGETVGQDAFRLVQRQIPAEPVVVVIRRLEGPNVQVGASIALLVLIFMGLIALSLRGHGDDTSNEEDTA